jgi:hypothetical protein
VVLASVLCGSVELALPKILNITVPHVDAVSDLFFGFALNAISFGHKNFTIRASCPNGFNKVTKADGERNRKRAR